MGSKQSSAESVWRDRLARFRKSKLTVSEFCRQEGVSDPTFYQWRKRLEPSSSGGRAGSSRPKKSRSFVPVSVPASMVAEIEFPNGVRIRVPATNAEALRMAIMTGNEVCQEAR